MKKNCIQGIERISPVPRLWTALGTAVMATTLAACGGWWEDAPKETSTIEENVALEPEPPSLALSPASLGVLEIDISGIGSKTMSSSVRWEDGTERRHVLNASPNATSPVSGGLDIKSSSIATIDTGGFRYITATFLVRNAQVCATPGSCAAYNVARTNLTFLAAIGSTIPGTPFSRFLRQDGSPAAPEIATQFLPAHGMRTAPSGAEVDPQLTSMQIFREAELPQDPSVELLPYGYVVSNIADGGRTLPANPAPDQFDGWVTIGYRVPLQADSANNPFRITLRLRAVEDTITRVTQSLEETDAAVVARAAALGAVDIAVPCKRPTQIAGANAICGARVAGSASSPVTTLDGVTAGSTPNTVVQAPVTLPLLAPDNSLQWPIPVEASPLTLQVRPFATLPLTSSGAAPRLNVLAHWNNRLFVGDETDGRIYEITNGTASLWFDAGAAVLASTGRRLDVDPFNFHSGFRSIAFHPQFASNGKFYTSLMEQRPSSTAGHRYLSDVPNPVAADSVLVEWTANPTSMVVAPNSYREVFRVGIPVYDHPIKQIMFRPGARAVDADFGLLYIAHGDGSTQQANPGGGMGSDARGKILRINPLASGGAPYSVPTSNPFVGSTSGMLTEVYSLGHRNPHHLCFARDGTLIVAEDGRDNIDEINIVKPGANYGWPAREGTLVHLAQGTLYDGVGALPANDETVGYTYPVAQFLHQGTRGTFYTRQALGGGYVVENGSGLHGHYFATDFVATGDVLTAPLAALKAAVTMGPATALRTAPLRKIAVQFDHDNNPATAPMALPNLYEMTRIAPSYDGSGRVDIRYGQGPRGELYLLSKRDRRVYLVTNSVF